jgi:hypothetical protein
VCRTKKKDNKKYLIDKGVWKKKRKYMAGA